MIRVYQFGGDPPHEGAELVRAQIHAGHHYRNDLVAIEIGRRTALRALDIAPVVASAIESLNASAKKERRQARWSLDRLRDAHRSIVRCDGGHWAVPIEEVDRYPYSPLYETDRIKLLDASLRRDARALTKAYWGTYLTVEDAADKVRKMPLYGDDGVTANDPSYQRARSTRIGGDSIVGQIGVQLQGGLRTADAFAGSDRRVRLIRDVSGRWSTLWLRVGSDGRAPVWAKFRLKLHREIPDAARWKWVRVSCRVEGPLELWSCEITVDDPAPEPRSLDAQLGGAIAVEVAWDRPDETLNVAYWRDDAGRSGTIAMPARDYAGIQKLASFRSLRDTLINDLRPKLVRALGEAREPLPRWLLAARDEIGAWHTKSPLWRTPQSFRWLYHRWHAVERCDAARSAFDALDAWEKRDRHLWEYEAGMRRTVLRRRREMYRVLAAQWSRQYKTLLTDDRTLSREALFGDASELRFAAAPSELREALRSSFGEDANTHPWRETLSEDDDRGWCERAIDAWIAGGAREEKKKSKIKHGKGGAWQSRKAEKRSRVASNGTARNASGNKAESKEV